MGTRGDTDSARPRAGRGEARPRANQHSPAPRELQLPECLTVPAPEPPSPPRRHLQPAFFPAFLLAAAGRRLRPDWPSATCGSCCWVQAGREEAVAAVAAGGGCAVRGGIWPWVPPRKPVPAAEETAGAGYQVLHKAKKSLQKLEQTLGSLLKMKASFSLEDGNPSSLEDVREEYVKRHFSNHSTVAASEAVSDSDSTVQHLIKKCEKQTMDEDGKPEFIQSPGTSSPDLVEFERYLYFYKHTVDVLVEHGIVCTEEVPLPEVSTAISHLWQELSEERRDSILQYYSERDFLMDPKAACQETACTAGGVRDSRGNSEEATGSSVSTAAEVMFEDACDVVAGFLDRSETQGMSRQSLAFTSCTSGNPEDHHRLSLQITNFLKSLFFANTRFCQEEDLQFDYETVMLRCTETFDDEDF
ncbi:stimulated by retinoic acid gene 8 protein homolog [Porphyrio hochstetteri]